uniref:Uncharacterized protein n=1 Tax=Micrurus paraensis TaxID=1970185 RepID=A0A2D4JVU1_9SAUR
MILYFGHTTGMARKIFPTDNTARNQIGFKQHRWAMQLSLQQHLDWVGLYFLGLAQDCLKFLEGNFTELPAAPLHFSGRAGQNRVLKSKVTCFSIKTKHPHIMFGAMFEPILSLSLHLKYIICNLALIQSPT